MSGIHLVESTRHAAVVEAESGKLSIRPLPAGQVKLSLIIPTFNESRSLEELIRRLSEVLDACLPDALQPASIPEILAIAGRTAPTLIRLVTEVIRRLGQRP